MHNFYTDGDFVGGAFTKKVKEGKEVNPAEAGVGGGKYVVLPAELRSLKEIGDAMCWGIPWGVMYEVSKLYRWLSK